MPADKHEIEYYDFIDKYISGNCNLITVDEADVLIKEGIEMRFTLKAVIVELNYKQIYVDILQVKNPLFTALKYNLIRFLRYLFEQGKLKSTKNLLYWALEENASLNTVKFLVEELGADIHHWEDVAATNAAEYGKLSILKYLIKKGAHYDVNDIKGAVKFGHLNIVKYLVNLGVDISTPRDVSDLVRLSIERGYFDIYRYLLSKGISIRAGNDIALITAADNGYGDIVVFLLDEGANIHANDDEALISASFKGHINVVKYLVKHGANVRSQEDTALLEATLAGHTDIAEYLVQKGADINRVSHIMNDINAYTY